MNKLFFIFVFFLVLFQNTLFSQTASDSTSTSSTAFNEESGIVFSKLNKFLALTPDEEKILNDLFSVNIGIMKFKYLGNIRDINPVDSQLLVNSIKLELDKVKNIRLDKKSAVLKALNVYRDLIGNSTTAKASSTASASAASTQKTSEKEKKSEYLEFLRQKLFFSKTELDESIIYEIFLEFRKNEKLMPILKQWIENMENPFYSKNMGSPFERLLKSEESICDEIKINNKGPIDFLFYGELERVDKYYFINLYIYSNLLKKRLAEISYSADSFNITERTIEKLKLVMSKVFLINYASLSVTTDDEASEIYLDGDYAGRKNVTIDYLVPSKYVLTIKKNDFKDKKENITLSSFDDKKITVATDVKEELQIINFYIEPLGTQIFLNSVYQGKTPFSKALPAGSYVLYAKNDLYEDHRYTFEVDENFQDEKNLVFHLKSKDIVNYFRLKKNLYYSSFWNFTFSMIATVPLIVFTKYFFDIGGGGTLFETKNYFYPNGPEYYKTTMYDFFYAITAPMVAHTAISLGLLFAALANYLITLEKKDFIPILDFYKNESGKDTLKIGGNYKF